VLTQDRFAQLVIARLRSTGADDIQYDPQAFSLAFRRPGGSGAVFLATTYARARDTPPAEVGKLIDAFLALPDQPAAKAVGSFAEVASQLLPVVRETSYFDFTNLKLRATGLTEEQLPKIPLREIVPGLVSALVRDLPDAMAPVSEADLQRWGVTYQEARRQAFINLCARTPEGRFSQPVNGLFVSSWNDSYDDSRMMITDLLKAMPLRGHPVVAIPSRNHLLVAGSQDPAALDHLVAMTAYVLEHEARTTSALILKYENDRFQPFGERMRSTALLRAAAFKRQHADYDQQKQLLEAWLQRQKVDVFVATAKAFQTQDDPALKSLCQWTKGVPTLLPKCDHLALLDMDSKELLMLAWPVAAEVLGPLLKPQGMAPERFLADEYPTDAQIRQLRASALMVTTVAG
jgi:uncharacterized protein YtpQ (UPF0354 family)